VSASTVSNPFGFHGFGIDAETNFHYLRNRYYDSELASFVSSDPLGYVDGPSMLAFAAFDPANLSDPLGLQNENSKSQSTPPEPESEGILDWLGSKLASAVESIEGMLGGDLKESVKKTGESADKFSKEFDASVYRKPGWLDSHHDNGKDPGNTQARYATDRTEAAGKSVGNALDLAENTVKTGYTATETAANLKVAKQLLVGGAGLASVLLTGDDAVKTQIDPGKFDYLFGRVTSSEHSKRRSRPMALEMKRLGCARRCRRVPDANRALGVDGGY
jgi:RHS repeat-associated protein